ncbi:AAA domain-containing protein [Phthorimaea operculella]|nr:AAA domain-containing protein [Phthorimaea operculella]
MCLERLKERHGFSSADEYNTKLQQLRERMTIQEKEEAEKVIRKRDAPFFEEMDPPNDFRSLTVLPTRDDLLDQQPFLRPNIVKGRYEDTEHYLDVQFRLLREDCFGPLRDGINDYIQNPNKKKYDNIRVYHNVKFIEPFISKNKIGETIQLDEKAMRRFKKINWAHSKRFIFGSLLLFTKDKCTSFITATILERDVKLLSQGKIPISIVDKVAGENIYNDDSSYTMIESEVYFEPYLHVLKALQDPKFPEHIAMSKYIIQVDPKPQPPAYLTLDSIFKIDMEDSTKTKFRVLNPMTWPSRDELGLNQSQYAAFELALTHEFAVIQGPPGTGKTYLGVKVARTLIENLSTEDSCLMLVICYTNHALDQFLENILPVTQSIVRIGGQSRNEAMENINLATLRKSRKVNFDTKKLFYEQKNILTSAVHNLKQAQERLDYINNGIISFETLKEHVPELHTLGNYYAQVRQDVKTDPLRHWLFENRNYRDFDNVMAEENVEEPNDEQINLNEVDDDEERIEMLLDEFDDDTVDFNNEDLPINIKTSFSINEVEKKLKSLILLYNRTQGLKKLELQREIIDLKSQADVFTEMIQNRSRQTRLHINNRMDLRAVPTAERWALYFRWANVVLTKFKRQMKPLQDSLDTANTAYEEARMMIDLKILKGIKVVGMTTSGAARLRKLLQALAPPIVIVEEAAEVLEQHIVTSLTKDCQHLILIGDHQQLRPSAAHNKLARDFNMEISLFERMITNGIHSRTLGVQHRMRPEIASLISPHIYPDLQNHPSVRQFPNVLGMADNLFFLTHNYKEEEVDDSASKSNQLEADLTLNLANYLMKQGYEPEDITILAAYSGQMFYMRKQREKFEYLRKVKITVVDNYQGEESKIILLSLVRNNSQDKIGFLGIENRVCVALSRARHGFYMFGNIDILKRKSPLWTKISETLEKNGSLGTALMLKCQSHPEQISTISSPADFNKVPEGGCLLKCNYEMPCGHGCTLVCHGYDRGHVNIKCYMPCERILCELGHQCPLKCSVKCQPCKRMVNKLLPCGHSKQIFCYLDPADPTVKCGTIVKVKLPDCQHEVDKPCHMKIEAVKCPVRCIYRVEQCGHECRLNCHVKDDPYHEKYACMKPCARAKKGCTTELVGDRGNHQCTRLCHEPCDNCTVEVTKKRSSCKHSERVPCWKDVDEVPCRKNCARVLDCGHFCKKKCHEPCGDCKQMVKKTIPDCKHEIKVACMTPATRDLCREKCERTLTCGHACTQRCDQICDPKKCTQLNKIKFAAPCGHSVALPCNVYNSMVNEWNPEVLLKYCKAPCGVELACEHTCAGTCGECHQGRLHLACQDQCNRTQICGHL